jgi:hypothetical protein
VRGLYGKGNKLDFLQILKPRTPSALQQFAIEKASLHDSAELCETGIFLETKVLGADLPLQVDVGQPILKLLSSPALEEVENLRVEHGVGESHDVLEEDVARGESFVGG